VAIAACHELARYQHEDLIARFLERWAVPRAEAEELFEELKKWLWLNARLNERALPTLMVSPSTRLIDEMWHTFLLYSVDYTQFCDRYFGFYLHHFPLPRAEVEARAEAYARNPEAELAELCERFVHQYELVHDYLGAETLSKWYAEYFDRYTDETLQRLARPWSP
jgi:hypothetical protein